MNENLITKLTAKILISDKIESSIGSGIVFYADYLQNKVYIITAAHCLFEDGDKFSNPRENIYIGLLNCDKNVYTTVKCKINYNIVSKDEILDIAIIVLEKKHVESILGELPQVSAYRLKPNESTFTIKGFPEATENKEIDCIKPEWKQQLPDGRFQLRLLEDYSTKYSPKYEVDGFSGSGVFVKNQESYHLLGILTRFRDSGKALYCQFIESVNNLLRNEFLPLIEFDYVGSNGINKQLFINNNNQAIRDLGNKYNSKFNVSLPIFEKIDVVERNINFRYRITEIFDNWLTKKTYNLDQTIQIDKTIENYKIIKAEILTFISNIDWSPEGLIVIDDLLVKINSFYEETQTVIYSFYDSKVTEEALVDKKKIDITRRILRELNDNIWELKNNIENLDFNLSNNPVLIIRGNAGEGKSHLLGHIVTQKMNQSLPIVFFLGHQFRTEKNIWENIISRIDCKCNKNQFLETLNNIGKQINSRILILIDAINEGAGKELWEGNLSGFISEFEKYKFIGLVLTIRNTYFEKIVPEEIIQNRKVTIIEHRGFENNEYEAINLYCNYYELKQPNFPILTPVFSNPLFLQLVCEGLKNNNINEFPTGFNGIYKVFNYYIDSIKKNFTKRKKYELYPNLVTDFINEFITLSVKDHYLKPVGLESVVKLRKEKFPDHEFLLNDLIDENVLLRNYYKDYSHNKEYEIIQFAYEKVGDFLTANKVLSEYKTDDDVKKAFKKNGEYGKIIEDFYWEFDGLMEAMAIIIPEKFKVEFFELYDWLYTDKTVKIAGNIIDHFNRIVIESLKWRLPEHLNLEKINDWIENKALNYIEYHDYLFYLCEMAAIPNHPFNSDRIHRILKNQSMPKRDAFWQEYLYYYQNENDSGKPYAIKRIINWAWSENVSIKTDEETARLIALVLSWTLSSTIRGLRDRATKALVNLLEEQPEVLVYILNEFSDCGDMYINERLYAVAYGCILRTTRQENIEKISIYVYNKIFANGKPPVHILLRDYARNTVEYGIYKGVSYHFDIDKIRPPYNTSLPESYPTDEEIEALKIDYDPSNFQSKNKFYHNRIIFSVMDHDFGYKEVGPKLDHLYPIPFNLENECNVFKKSLTKTELRDLKLIDKMIQFIARLNSSYNYNHILHPNYEEEKGKIENEYFNGVMSYIKKEFNDEQYSFIEKKYIPYLRNKNTKHPLDRFDINEILRWIVKRAFELGYDYEKHGRFDSYTQHYNYDLSKMERIGKKYQWLAYHEIMAVLVDNYTLKTWDDRKFIIYEGPVQNNLYLRDIDCAFIKRNILTDDWGWDMDVDKYGLGKKTNNLWFDTNYQSWDIDNWFDQTLDLPEIKQIIQFNHENEEWINLHSVLNWEEPKPIGVEKYDVSHKQISYYVNSYIIRKKNKKEIIQHLSELNTNDLQLYERDSYLHLMNREQYWSPTSKYYCLSPLINWTNL